jgi:hypothetical protein
MKKTILILAIAFTLGTFFTSCRQTNKEQDGLEVTDDINDDLENVDRDLERDNSEFEDSIQPPANEIEGID